MTNLNLLRSAQLLRDALTSWTEILHYEEARVEQKNVEMQMKTNGLAVSQQISGDQDSGGCLVGGVCADNVPRRRRRKKKENTPTPGVAPGV